MSMDLFRQLLEAQRLAQADLLRRTGVVGVAIGFRNFKERATDQLAVSVLVEQKKPVEALSEDDLVPQQVNGMRTDVVEVGRLEAHVDPRDRFRPNIPAGVSIGHYMVTAGTLGAVVFDRNTGEPLLLSNNHVLANSNDAVIGDAILQPGPTDHGVRPDDIVAKLHRFEKLRFYSDYGQGPAPPTTTPPLLPGGGCDIVELFVNVGNALAKINGSAKRLTSVPAPKAQSSDAPIFPNQVDAALARPNNPTLFQQDIAAIGRPNGVKKPQLGMRIRKFGRTTGYTEGTIMLMNATVDVAYGENLQARFTGQVITSPMSQGGDSGALIIEEDSYQAVGLLFAGSRRATIFTPMDVVLDVMDVDL